MMKTPAVAAPSALSLWLQRHLSAYMHASFAQQALDARMERKWALLKKDHAQHCAPYIMQQAYAYEALQTLVYQHHHTLFAQQSKQSILVNDRYPCTIGFQPLCPVLAKPSLATCPKIIQALREISPSFVRTSSEVNTPYLFSLPSDDSRIRQAEKIGLEIIRDQTFFIQLPKTLHQ